MKKYILLLMMLFALQSYAQKDISIFELNPSQSMCITGKGAGQDAAINPHKDGNSIAIIKNLGENSFTIRVEYQGKLFLTHILEVNKATKVSLRQGSVLYLDSDLKAKAKVDFKEGVK